MCVVIVIVLFAQPVNAMGEVGGIGGGATASPSFQADNSDGGIIKSTQPSAGQRLAGQSVCASACVCASDNMSIFK